MKKLIKLENIVCTTKEYKEAMKQNIELVNQCKTEQELTELLNTGTKKTIDFLRAAVGAYVVCRLNTTTKAEFVQLCVIAIMNLREEKMFKTLSFDEQITYLKSIVSPARRFELIRLMDIAKIEARIYEIYPERAEEFRKEFSLFSGSLREHSICCSFELAIKQEKPRQVVQEAIKEEDKKLCNLPNTSSELDKRITKRNIKLIKQCRTKQELKKLLSTGNKHTIEMIANFLVIHKSSFKACINAILEMRFNHG